jgi:hypothetical protein
MLTYDGGTIMAVKILIQRKVKPGKEKELYETVKELRSKAIHAEGIFPERPCAPLKTLTSTW